MMFVYLSSLIAITLLSFHQKKFLVTAWTVNYVIYFGVHALLTEINLAVIYSFLCWIAGVMGLYIVPYRRLGVKWSSPDTRKIIKSLSLLLFVEILIRLIFDFDSRHTAIAADKKLSQLIFDQIEIGLLYSIPFFVLLSNVSRAYKILPLVLVGVASLISGSKGELIVILLFICIMIFHELKKNEVVNLGLNILKFIPYFLLIFSFAAYIRIKDDSIIINQIQSQSYNIVFAAFQVVVLGRTNMLSILENIIKLDGVNFQFFSDFTNLLLIVSGLIPSSIADRPEINLGRYFAADIGLNDSMTSYVAMTLIGESYLNFGFYGFIMIFFLAVFVGFILNICKFRSIYYGILLLLNPFVMSFEMNFAAGFWRSIKMLVTVSILLMMIKYFHVFIKYVGFKDEVQG